MKTSCARLSAFGGILVAVAAIGWADDPAAVDHPLVIAGIPKTLTNPVFSYSRAAAERAAAQLGNITLKWTAPENNDPAAQAAILDALVDEGVQGVFISVADPAIVGPAIDRAVAMGIPVITFDSDAPASRRLAFYGVDDLAVGRRLGTEIAGLLGGTGRVAILSGSAAALNLQQRVAGARDALAPHPGIAVLGPYFCDDDLAQSGQIISTVTAAEQPDGWVLVGGWPLFTEHGLDAITPGQVKVVAVDPLPATWKWIQGNYVQVCLGQKVMGWGDQGVNLVLKAIRHEALPTHVDSGFDVVTPATLPAYMAQWAAMEQ